MEKRDPPVNLFHTEQELFFPGLYFDRLHPFTRWLDAASSATDDSDQILLKAGKLYL